MPEYLSPGVYVEEIDRGPKPIEGVGTSTACFVGFTEKAQEIARVNGDNVTRDLFNKPQLVTNWTQYLEKFGGFVSGAYMPQAVYGFFMNGGSRCYVLSVKTIPKAQVGLLNADGKTAMVAQAAVAGYDGAKLRVRIDAPALPPSTSDRKKGKPATDGAAPVDGGAQPPADAPAPLAAPSGDPYFHLTVERERANGSWKSEEVFRNVTLAEVETPEGKKPAIAWPNGKKPQLIELVITDESAPLTRIYPREQQQSLNIDSKQLAPATVSEFQGEVLERTGIEGLEAIDDITMSRRARSDGHHAWPAA